MTLKPVPYTSKWGSQAEEPIKRNITQPILCYICVQHDITDEPEKIIYKEGTSLCLTHAKDPEIVNESD